MLVFGEDPKQEVLAGTKILTEAKYSFNFTRLRNTFCLSLHYNESNCFLFVSGEKIFEFEGKHTR